VRVGGVTYPKKSFRHRRLTWVPHKLRVLLGRVLSFRHELPLPKSESLLLCVHTRTCVVGRRSLEVGLGMNRDGSLSAPARCSAERTTAAQPVLCHILTQALCRSAIISWVKGFPMPVAAFFFFSLSSFILYMPLFSIIYWLYVG
jgi:hypothetical protein